MIPRFLNEQIMKTKKSVMLLGPRQVGKSTLTKAMQPDHLIQLVLESSFQQHAKDPDLVVRQVAAHKEGRNVIVIDEVQRLPSRSIQSEKRDKQIVSFSLIWVFETPCLEKLNPFLPQLS